MKKSILILLVAAFIVTLFTVSCSKKNDNPEKTYSELIVGRWKTVDEGYYEEYKSDGTAKFWAPVDDIPEEDAKPFTWSIDSNNKLTQLHPMEVGTGTIPQYCNILILNETTFKYNNEGWRETYNLIRDN